MRPVWDIARNVEPQSSHRQFCYLQKQQRQQRCIPSTARRDQHPHIACRDMNHPLSYLIQDWTEAKMAMGSASAMMGYLPRLTSPTACIGASRPSASTLPAFPSMMNQPVSLLPLPSPPLDSCSSPVLCDCCSNRLALMQSPVKACRDPAVWTSPTVAVCRSKLQLAAERTPL